MRNAALVVIFVTLAGAAQAHPATAPAPSRRELRAPRRGLIHPLLDTTDHEFVELKPFQYKVERLRDQLKARKRIDSMAFYFRDLDNGLAFGVDQNTPFKPASLLKLPLMMALLKANEKDPDLLARKVVVKAAPRDMVPTYPPSVALVPGREYTLDELLSAMIARSDNSALITLFGAVSEGEYLRVYEDLGLRVPNVRDIEDPITVREYAAFFRILYNASYLTKDLSQKALEYLAACEFDKGLKAGTPPAVIIAHKFGESAEEGKPERQLHDCGIVYHPEKPYVVCVMTRGKDVVAMADAIAQVSRLVYAEVDASRQR